MQMCSRVSTATARSENQVLAHTHTHQEIRALKEQPPLLATFARHIAVEVAVAVAVAVVGLVGDGSWVGVGDSWWVMGGGWWVMGGEWR